MTAHAYRDAVVTIDGKPFAVEHVSIARAPEPEDTATNLIGSPSFYEFTCETEVQRSVYDAFVHAMTPPVRGATAHVLAKRAAYRSRKGRQAARRLHAAGYAGIVRFGGYPWVPMPKPILRSILDASAVAMAKFHREGLKRFEECMLDTASREEIEALMGVSSESNGDAEVVK